MFRVNSVHEMKLESNFKGGILLIHHAEIGLKTCADEEEDIKTSRIKLGHQIIQGFSINNVLPSGGLQLNKFELEDTSSDAETNQEEEES